MIKTLTKIKQKNRSLCKKRRFVPPMPKRAVRTQHTAKGNPMPPDPQEAGRA
jgi:hypothetical protein